jgi:hypothetical protein
MLLVPFNQDWADSGSKLDLKGVYQSTTPGDDRICPALPIRRHTDWTRKGLKFVTLSTLHDVGEAQDFIRTQGISLSELRNSYILQGSGPFNIPQYLKEQPDREATEADQLRARLAQIERKPRAADGEGRSRKTAESHA